MSYKANYLPQNKKPQVKAPTSTQGDAKDVINSNFTTNVKLKKGNELNHLKCNRNGIG